jgi:hypothetical protein
MENKTSIRRGDLVQDVVDNQRRFISRHIFLGLAVEVDVNMWGEEAIPTGVRILWEDGDISVVYEDEVEVVK